MAGLATGLAQGLQAGISLGQSRNETEFRQQMAARQQARADQGEQLKATAADRDQAVSALAVVQKNKDSLAARAGALRADPGTDPSEFAALRQDSYKLQDQEKELQRRAYGQELTDWGNDAQRTADDLQFGRKKISDLTPQELTNMVALKTLRPASDFIDTPDGPGPVGQALQKFHEGMAKMQLDGGAQALDGFNDLFAHELKGIVGTQTADGLKITNAEFAPPVPHPGDPTHAMFTAKITTQDEKGNISDRYVPILDDHGKMVADPADHPDATVKNYNLTDVMHHIGAMETMYQAINNHPELRNKAIEGFLNGHEDAAQAKIDLIHSLGHDPREYAPKTKVSGGVEYAEDPFGSASNIQSVPKALDPRAAAKDDADTRLTTDKAKMLESGRTPDGAPVGGVPSFSIVQGSDGKSYAFNSKTGGVRPIAGLPDGATASKGAAGAGINLLSKEAIDDAANTWKMTGTPPTGYGRSPATLAAIANRKSEIETAEGDTASAAATKAVANKAAQHALSDITTRETAMEANARSAEANFQTIEQLASKVDRTGSPIINRLKQAWGTDVIQDPDLKALKNGIAESATEYAKVVTGSTGGQGVTDAANKQMQELISASDSPEAFKAALTTMRQMIVNRRQGFSAERQSLLDSMGGKIDKPIDGSLQAPVKVSTKAERDKLPSGTLYIGPDGHTARVP